MSYSNSSFSQSPELLPLAVSLSTSRTDTILHAQDGSHVSCYSSSVDDAEYSNEEGEIEDSNNSSSVAVDVLSELTLIRSKLEDKSTELHEVEEKLLEREEVLVSREQMLEKRELALMEKEKEIRNVEKVMLELQVMMNEWIEQQARNMGSCELGVKGHSPNEMSRVLSLLKEKNKENERLADSFTVLRKTCESLREQLQRMSQEKEELQKHLSSARGRLTNLLRMGREGTSVKPAVDKVEKQKPLGKALKPAKLKTAAAVPSASSTDFVAHLMHWIVQLYPSTIAGYSVEAGNENLTEIVCRLVPHISDHLLHLSSCSPQLQCQSLEFTLLAVRLVSANKQKHLVTASMRRLGEVLYNGGHQKVGSVGDTVLKESSLSYVASPDLHIRVLSSLIIIATLSQVQIHTHILGILQQDLKDHMGKELFMLHEGVHVVLPLMKPELKVLCSQVVDLFLLLSMESAVTQLFLEWCRGGEWFEHCTHIFRSHQQVDTSVLEKLSIILQRLSKNRANKRMFERYHLAELLQNVLSSRSDPNNPFLSLNLRSILMNLTPTLPQQQ